LGGFLSHIFKILSILIKIDNARIHISKKVALEPLITNPNISSLSFAANDLIIGG